MQNQKETLKIRPIKKEDESEVAKLIRQVMSEYDCVGEGYSIEDPEVDHMYDAYNSDRAVFYVIENRSGEIAGCGGMGQLSGTTENICELKKMYFYKDIRGLGLGKELLERCIEDARRIGYKKMYLETVERMKRANNLYAKRGFKLLTQAVGQTGHSSCDSFYALDLS